MCRSKPPAPALAKLIEKHKLAEPILRRAINANFRLGEPENAAGRREVRRALGCARGAARSKRSRRLASGSKPSIRDHVMGLVWPLPDKTRDPKLAAEALRPMLPGMLQDAPDPVRDGGARSWPSDSESIRSIRSSIWSADAKASADVRAAALKLLAARNSPKLGEALKIGLLSKAPALRKESIRLQTTQPDAVAKLERDPRRCLARRSAGGVRGAADGRRRGGGHDPGQLDGQAASTARSPAPSQLDLLERRRQEQVEGRPGGAEEVQRLAAPRPTRSPNGASASKAATRPPAARSSSRKPKSAAFAAT